MSFSDDFTAPLWSVHALLPWNCCRCRPGQERNVNCNTYGCSLVLRHSWYHIYIYDYICIYHIVTKEGDSLRLGGSRLAQHYLLDRSFQALTELSLRSGEKKAGAVGMSRVIACHTKEVLMHSKHTWYSYGIHMVFIWYSYGIQWRREEPRCSVKQDGERFMRKRLDYQAGSRGIGAASHSYSSLLVFALFALLL